MVKAGTCTLKITGNGFSGEKEFNTTQMQRRR
jgi:hypothetical protein